MAGQDDFPGGGRDRVLRQRDILSQRQSRVLDDRQVVTVLLQDLEDAFPTRPVGEVAVDQDDVLDAAAHVDLSIDRVGWMRLLGRLTWQTYLADAFAARSIKRATSS